MRRRRIRPVGGLERAGDALPDGFGFFALLLASLGAQETFLLTLVLALQEFFDFAYAHAGTDPPPPTEEALPECDGPNEFWHPGVLVLAWDVKKVEGGGDESEGDGAYAKGGSSTVCAPGLTAVDEETPYDKKGGEENRKGGVADVAGIFCDGHDAVSKYEGEELHDGGDNGEWT